MRPKVKLIDPIDVDTDGIAAAQAVGGAVALTLDGALISGGKWVASDGLGRLITILSAGNDSGISFVIAGSDPEGRAISETVTGANTSTATSTKYFSSITSVTSSAAAAGNVSVGISKYFRSNVVCLNHYASDGPPVCAIDNVTGTIDVTAEECFGDVQNNEDVTFYAIAALSNAAVDTRSKFTSHATGIRLKGNNYISGASCNFVVNQNGV